MRIINSYALDLFPEIERKPGPSLLSSLLSYWKAVGEGLDAAQHYHALTRAGVPHAEAVQAIFAQDFRAS